MSRSTPDQNYMVSSRRGDQFSNKGQNPDSKEDLGISCEQLPARKHQRKVLRKTVTVGIGEASTSNAILSVVEID